MNGDLGMNYLNMLLDAAYLAEFRRSSREAEYAYRDEEAEMDPVLEEQSAAASGQAQDEYEEDLIFEARAIVGGVSHARPTVEHLRVLLQRCATSSLIDTQTTMF
jgi:hypothetical protein